MYHDFLYISFPLLHDYDVQLPIFTFYGGRKRPSNDILYLFLNFDTVFWNSAPEEFVNNGRIEQDGVSSIKLETA